MKLKRNYITPFISLVFLVVSLSGLLMFFHMLDGYTEVVHEVLGLSFIICAIFHIIVNWKSLKLHFKKGVFLPALLGVLILSGTLVIFEIIYPPGDIILINRLVKSPIHNAFKALEIDYDHVALKLKVSGISIEEARNIEDLWIRNDISPEEVVDLITD